MTGPHDSVIGVEADLAIQRMRTGIPVRFKPPRAASGWRASCSIATRNGPRDGHRAATDRRRLAPEPGVALRHVQTLLFIDGASIAANAGEQVVNVATASRLARACSRRRSASG